MAKLTATQKVQRALKPRNKAYRKDQKEKRVRKEKNAERSFRSRSRAAKEAWKTRRKKYGKSGRKK